MNSWNKFADEIQDAQLLIGRGQSFKALERLNLILAQLNPQLDNHVFHSASLLRIMAEATRELGQAECANRYLRRAAELFRQVPILPVIEQVETFLAFSEDLQASELSYEAEHFAEVALECIAAGPEEFLEEDVAEILRRYSRIVSNLGQSPTAHLALSLGLLIVVEMSGLESSIANDLVAFADTACSQNSRTALSKVGRALVCALR